MVARERGRDDVRRRRANFALARRFVDPGRLVFLDETGVRTDMTRRYGRSLGGSRCVDSEPAGHWRTTTLIGAMRASGPVPGAAVTLDGATTGDAFLAYVRDFLAPALSPGDVVVMDNLSAHRVAGVAEAVGAAGANVWHLPAYSPDLNPIEKLWAKLKATLRRARAATAEALSDAIDAALASVTSGECVNYLRSCGYGT